MAQVVVSKCADSLPLYRQAKAYRRVGVQVNDSTLGDLFHRAAELTKPLSDRLLQLVAEKEIVLADGTTQRVQEKGKTRTAWLWSFIARDEAEAKPSVLTVGGELEHEPRRTSSPPRSGTHDNYVNTSVAGPLQAIEKVLAPTGVTGTARCTRARRNPRRCWARTCTCHRNS